VKSPQAIDQKWMEAALTEARLAARAGEVPVGAVVVQAGRIVARAHNETLGASDPTAHAEIVALRRAAAAVGTHRLVEATAYVTLEPCAMCVGAMIQARLAGLVFACRDPKAGAVVSLFELASDGRLNHRIPFHEGPGGIESSEILRDFFRARRGA
jgi:tRNA(adenine34) deaminase